MISANTTLDIVLVPAGIRQLSGKVYDGAGIAAPNQPVYLTPEGSPGLSDVTDQAGEYSFSVAPGQHRLRVYTTNNPGGLNLPNGYDIQTSGPFAITETTQLDLPLPLKEVTVEVRTPGGAGLAGVMLFTNAPTNPQTLAGKPASGYSFYNQNKVFTDENGRATLWLFPTAAGPNRYTITAVPPAGQPYATVTKQNIDVAAAQTEQIDLLQPVTLSGKVYDGAGIAAPNQPVYLTPEGSPGLSDVTDQAGEYSFSVAPGQHRLRVYTTNNPGGLNLPNGYDIQTSGPFAITETTQLDLPLPLKEVTVEVRTPGGAGLAGVMLFTNAPTNPQTLAGKPASGYSFYNQNKVFTDENGRATLWLFPTAAGPNRYTITAVPPAGQPYATVTKQNIDVAAAQTEQIDLLQPVTLSGKVYDGAGIAAPNQPVYLTPEGSPGLSDVTDQAGEYSFSVAPGQHRLRVYTTNNPGGLNLPNGYDIQTSGPFAITETTQLDLPLPLKEVTVEVRTPGGAGLAGVMLFTNAPTNPQTLAGKPASGYSFYNQNKVFTDENGRATLWLFPTAAGPNRYTITAVPPAGQPYATVTAQNVPVVGNDFKVIVLVSTDTTPPTITASATSNGSPYIGGAWTNAPVTVHFTCSDAQSGVASCPADQVFPAEGTFSASGTATDNGGNTAGTTFAPINIDLTPPVLTSLVSPGPSQPAGHFLDWATAAPMPTARGYAGTVTLNGFIYAIGGADPYPTTIGANERYDPATNTWTSLAPMPTPRAGTAVVAGADGKIYVIGGWTTGSDSLSTVEVYDLATNSWSSRPNAPVPANGMATATAANGDIYLFGGYPGCCFNYLANVYRYDPVNGTYTPRASMPIGRQGARAVPADNGKIYLFGGNGSPAVNGKEVTAYDPATNSWQAKSPMPLGVTYAAGFRATNGRIYILGARDGTGARVTMEYDVANDSWVLGDASPVSAVIQGSATTAAGEYFLLGGVDPLGANPLAGLPAVSRGTLAHIWTSGPVAVHWSCVDALSGVNAGLSDLADDVFNVSGTASATCLDNAGNSVTSTRSVTIAPPADTTPPELTAAATKEDGSAYVLGNWSNQVVTVRYTCIDSGSGVNASASDLSDDVELTSGTATATCVDNAGNQSVATVPVLVDHVTTTHYTATVVGQAPWNDTGINLPAHSQVSITASGIIVIAGSDGGHDPDGIPGCYEGFGASPGPGLTCLKLVARVGGGPVFEIGTSGAFSVAAGGRLYLTINDSFHGDNSGAWQAAVNVSLGAPEIYATATKADGQPYTAGMWTNGPVTVHFTCADGESGIATCPSDQTDTAAGLSYVSGTASDVAGNSASTTFGPIRIDTGVPSFTSVTYTRADGSTYVPGTWTNQAVTVTFACQDLVSGVANCPGSQTFAAEGSYAGTVLTTDNAGNQGSTAYGPVLIDNLGANTTIHVVDHNGLGLSGATASAWYSGAWHAIPGSSDAQGRLPAGALPKVASLQVAVTFNGTRLQLAYAQLTASDFTFQTQLVSMRLHDSSGQPLDVGAASYYAGSWRTAGNTISGTVTAEMLPGSYSFAMIYNGTRVQLTQDIGANPVVVFQTVGVTVRLSSSAGGALDGGAASYYAGSWRSIGDTVGGQVRVELLPGNYTFAMTYLGTRAQVAHDVGSNPVVTFTTGKVHSASDTATSYYAGSWRPFVQDMELLAGSYTFAFSGAPNKSQTLAGGVVNVID